MNDFIKTDWQSSLFFILKVFTFKDSILLNCKNE